MEILYVLPKFDFFMHGRRGRVAHALGVVDGLVESGAKVTVLSGPGTRQALSSRPEVHVVEVPQPSGGVFRQLRWNVHMASSARRLLQPSGSVRHVIARYAVSKAFLLFTLFRRIPHCVRCLEVNSLAYHQYRKLPKSMRYVVHRIELTMLGPVDLVYTVSNALADDIRGFLAEKELAVVPNAAQKRVELKLDWGQSIGAEVRFVYLGVLQPYYEFDVVVDAFQFATERGLRAELHFYGDGEQIEILQRKSEGKLRINLHGRYDLERLLGGGEIGANTVLILPCKPSSLVEIGSPIKLYEYMSLGLPIISSDISQAREVLSQGKTAYFYRAGEFRSLAEAMMALAGDIELRRSLGEAARYEFLAKHTWEMRMKYLQSQLTRVDRVKG